MFPAVSAAAIEQCRETRPIFCLARGIGRAMRQRRLDGALDCPTAQDGFRLRKADIDKARPEAARDVENALDGIDNSRRRARGDEPAVDRDRESSNSGPDVGEIVGHRRERCSWIGRVRPAGHGADMVERIGEWKDTMAAHTWPRWLYSNDAAAGGRQADRAAC